MSSVKWYRVIDPMNPLCGCDVRGWDAEAVFGPDDALAVVALRRIDVLVGDRPYQLVAPEGSDLGVAIRMEHLEESPIQNDTVEIGYDLPHGKCVSESVVESLDGGELRIARYEHAIQVAYGESDGELHATCTLRGDDRDDRLNRIIDAFDDEQNFDYDGLVSLMKMEGR